MYYYMCGECKKEWHGKEALACPKCNSALILPLGRIELRTLPYKVDTHYDKHRPR